MMRSLYSAISGLKNHQIMMDTIGNNIANVNTMGYKRSRVTFATMLSQELKGASSPSQNQGGTNPVQVGLGAVLGSIDKVMTQGSTQSTGKNTDMMIQGPGFFVLNNAGQQVYSRAGGFSQDKNGNLIDPSTGSFVQGYSWGADDSTPANFSTLAPVKFALGDPLPQLTTITMPAVPTTFPSNGWTSATTFNSPSLTGSWVNVGVDLNGLGATLDSATGTITFDTAAHAVSAAAKVLNIKHQAAITLPTQPGTFPGNGWTNATTYVDSSWKGASIALLPTGATFNSNTGTLTFDTASNASAAAGNAVLNLTWTPPSLTSFSIDASGAITGVYSNGTVSTTHKIAQIALASFSNDSGLENVGNSFYTSTNNSGNPSVGSAGQSGRGSIVPGAIEMSNVDLSQEFTDMIVAQRGFQANSRVITVSDSLLQELIDLKRQ
ncbi:MAG: flagellar hook protein FlgE [Desulfitobacteriaceae bacterium]